MSVQLFLIAASGSLGRLDRFLSRSGKVTGDGPDD